MTIDITEILVSILGVITTIIAVMVIPYIKSKLSAEQEEKLAYWVDVAVMAAEGLFKQSGMGDEKFEYVMNFLEAKGLGADFEEIEALVEASVYQLINQFKEVEYDESEEVIDDGYLE